MIVQVSVVVPTYQRPHLLERCLTALLNQDLHPAEYEVIVADDAADPQTEALVRRLAATGGDGRPRPYVCYLPVVDTEGPAAARNAGWRAASGRVIAFTDDDCVPEPTWLRAGLAALADGVAGVSGRVMVPLPDRPTDYELSASGLARSRFVTANCFYTRDALSSVGGFDERFEVAWREDTDLYFRLLKAGCELVDAPEATVVHPVRPARWGVSLGQQRKSTYNALLYKLHPDLYRIIGPGPPWHYYWITLAALTAAASAVGGRRRLSLAAAVAWAALTVRFCASRLRGTSHAPSHVAEMVVTSALIPPLSIYWRLRGAIRYRVYFL